MGLRDMRAQVHSRIERQVVFRTFWYQDEHFPEPGERTCACIMGLCQSRSPLRRISSKYVYIELPSLFIVSFIQFTSAN